MHNEDQCFKVCVTCFTYNQASYITDTMNGFVMQQTDFPYVCCIVDDASTDGEQEVIKNYINDYFEIMDDETKSLNNIAYGTYLYARHKININCYFVVLLLKKNHYKSQELKYVKRTYISRWENSSSYIALCEGDDYWTDPLKLQKQFNFLESNPDYGMCYTKATVIKGERIIEETGTKDVSFEGLLSYSNFPTLTRLYRTSIYKQYISDIKPNTRSWMMGDYPFAFYCVLKSKVGFIDVSTAVYRLLENSASHSGDIDYLIRFYESADDVRYFFVNNYVEREDDVKRFHEIIKKNTINYKMSIYLRAKNIEFARTLYLTEKALLTTKNKLYYYANCISPSITSIIYSFFKTLKNSFLRK